MEFQLESFGWILAFFVIIELVDIQMSFPRMFEAMLFLLGEASECLSCGNAGGAQEENSGMDNWRILLELLLPKYIKSDFIFM